LSEQIQQAMEGVFGKPGAGQTVQATTRIDLGSHVTLAGGATAPEPGQAAEAPDARSGATVRVAPFARDAIIPRQEQLQYVIRAGESKPQDIIAATKPLPGNMQNLGPSGFSTSSALGMDPNEIAMAAGYPNVTISYTTVQKLAALGYPIISTPLPGQPLHHTVLAPFPLPQSQAEILSQVFSNHFPNPNRVPRSPGGRRR